MTEPIYKICFKTAGMEAYKPFPFVEEAMQRELMRVYNIYADMANTGITEQLNNEFDRRHPGYFRKNKDKEWYEMTLYNKFMADGYNRLICDKLNEERTIELLEFYVCETEVQFMGRLRTDKTATIEFYMKVVS